MEQKTIWKAFLIIGISIMLLYSCNSRIDRLKTVTYIYKNESENDLTLEIYNIDNIMFKSYDIPSDSSIETNTTQSEGGPALFYFESTTNSIGNSVIIRFSDNKCIYFFKDNLDKIFDVKEYDNYSEDLLNRDEYTLFYTITNQNYNDAINCN